MERDNGKRMTEFLKYHAEQLGIAINEKQTQQFLSYYELLAEYNKVMNLTAITEPEETAIRHFLDSAAPLLFGETTEIFSKPGIKILDVGTGAGFPGIPIAILFPEAEVSLADSLQKRTGFLKNVKEKAETDNIHIYTGRAEDLARDKTMREAFDIAVSRAVAELPVLCEYCLPFVKPGGAFAAWKGPAAEEETEKAENAIRTLGGGETKLVRYKLPKTEAARCLVMIRKTDSTPDKYPRRAGIPSKRPI